jgi:hypothetical protein
MTGERALVDAGATSDSKLGPLGPHLTLNGRKFVPAVS